MHESWAGTLSENENGYHFEYQPDYLEKELAINLNGKKKKLKRSDFETAMKSAGIEEKTIENIFSRFAKSIPKWHEFIEISFVPDEVKRGIL